MECIFEIGYGFAIRFHLNWLNVRPDTETNEHVDKPF